MKKVTPYEMAMCGVMAALMCIAGPLTIPIGPVPVTLINLVIFIAIVVTGRRLTMISCIVYLLLGAAGLPVFSGFSGGIAKLAGPTGGYLIGYLFMIWIGGYLYEHTKTRPIIGGCGLILGLLVLYAFGTAWFIYQMKAGIVYALSICVWPFLPFDIIKTAAAVLVGRTVRKAVLQAGFTEDGRI